MRTTIFLLIGLLFTSALSAADAPAPLILGRGLHHRVVQNESGGSYTELADGLCYIAENGNYVDSEELFEIVGATAVARRGQHKATLAANINSERVVELIAPDGKRFVSRFAGLSYFDAASGLNVLIAQVQDSIGIVHPPNQVIYPAALAGQGFTADVRYIWRKGGFAQDIILRQSPPSPLMYGLNPDTTRLQAWTLFLEAPQPEIETRVLAGEEDPLLRQVMAQPDLIDQTLRFGALQISQGRAFELGQEGDLSRSIPVGKEWGKSETGDTYLIESVEYPAAKAALDALPKEARATQPKNANIAARKLSRPQLLKELVGTRRRSRPLSNQNMQVAKAGELKRPGFVLDYDTLYGPPYTYNNYTFAANQTYYITAQITLNGTTALERGTVLKLAPYVYGGSVGLRISGSSSKINCAATQWNPSYITAKDDNTVGEAIDGSTGNPSGYYGNIALWIDYASNPLPLSNLRIRYAYIAFELAYTSSGAHDLRHSQFVNCGTVFYLYYSTVRARNILVCNDLGYSSGVIANGDLNSYLHGENMTLHRGNLRPYGVSYPSTYLTNSLLVVISSWAPYYGANNQSLSSEVGVFRTVGAGSHYLFDETYLDQGTTAIEPTLLAELRKRTTHPPVDLTSHFTTPTTLSPEVPLDTGPIDLGYHYDPIDFTWSGLNLESTLVLTGGVAIAHSGTPGTILKNGAKFISEGSPVQRNHIVQYTAVQENAVAWRTAPGTMSVFSMSGSQPSPAPEISLRFTDIDFAADVDSDRKLLDFGTYSVWSLALTDCELTAAFLNVPLYDAAPPEMTITLTNNLFRRVTFTLRRDTLTPVDAFLFNNSFINSTLALNHNSGIGDWEVRDNFFDAVSLSAGNSTFVHSHNGYLSTTQLADPVESGDVVITTRDYQSALLGTNYYGAGMAALIGSGKRTPAVATLSHHTVKTDQSKAGTLAKISIGYHVIAVSGNLPINSDTDSLADYFEDRDGDNVLDAAESNWSITDTDGDTVDDATEFFQGRNPRVANTVVDTSGTVVNLRVFTPSR